MNNDRLRNKEHGTFKAYLLGFLFSVVLTFISYFLVDKHLLSGSFLVVIILALGSIQAVVQLVFFLHLGEEPKPKLNLLLFLFMLLVLVVIIVGSLWIMANLNYRMI
jgi:cytochrome o ubiquinol oxidase operon protein cyoD